MNGPSFDNIFDVYRLLPHKDGGFDQHHVGRIMQTPTHLDVLADFFGFLKHLDGPLDDRRSRAWASFRQSPYFEVVSREDIRNGSRPDLIPEQDPGLPEFDPNGDVQVPNPERTARAGRPPSVFEYHHAALSQPVTIEIRNGQTYFNGMPVSYGERQRLLENIRNGTAQIRYKRSEAQQAVMKAERQFVDLVKIEPHLQDSLAQLRDAVKSGHVHPDVLKHITGEIFTDPMVKGVGNKKAYTDFLSRPRPGVHVRMDGNDFGSINKIHSFEHGNQAITAMGQAMREAMDEAVGRQHGKLFRIGGDEFHAHVPTHEHAARFARVLRSKLDRIAPIGGTHSLSVSMGFGPDAESSDQASIQAKTAKKAMGYQVGRAKTHAFSAVPGFEGHVPLDPEQLPHVDPHVAGVAEKPNGGVTPPVSPAPTPAPAAPTLQAPKLPK